MALSLNLKPSASTTSQLIYDPVQSPGSSVDGTASLTKVLNPAATATLPISAALEIQSTTGAFVLPRMTTAQMLALDNSSSTVTPGMMIYNITTNSFWSYSGSGWSSQQSSASVTLLTADVTALQTANPAFVIVPAPGAGLLNVINNFSAVLNFAAAFVNTGGATQVVIGYGPTPANVIARNATQAPGTTSIPVGGPFMTAAANAVYVSPGVSRSVVVGSSNAPIAIACNVGNYTGGVGSSITITVNYYTISSTI